MSNNLTIKRKATNALILLVLGGIVLSSSAPLWNWWMEVDSELIELSDMEDDKTDKEEDDKEDDTDEKIRDFINGHCFLSADMAKKDLLFKYHHSAFHPEIHTPPPKIVLG